MGFVRFHPNMDKARTGVSTELWSFIELEKSDNTRNEYYESLSKQVEAIEELFRNSIKWWFRIEISKFHSWLQYCDFQDRDSATEWPQLTPTVIISLLFPGYFRPILFIFTILFQIFEIFICSILSVNIKKVKNFRFCFLIITNSRLDHLWGFA